jgi:hypothetical protein
MVRNSPPVADAGGPYEVLSGSEVIFDGSGSFDADGDTLTSYSWNFGDGNTGIGVDPSHIYESIGVYAASLIVSDGTAVSMPSNATVYVDTDPGDIELVALELAPGWNFISFYRQPINTDIQYVLSTISSKYESVWAYDSVMGKWMRHVVGGSPSLNDLDEMGSGFGYMIKMKYSGILIFQGTRVSTTITLREGWNFVGYNSEYPGALEDCLASINGKYRSVWTYDPDTEEWLRCIPDGPLFLHNLEFLQPGSGYWIDAKEECVWSME